MTKSAGNGASAGYSNPIAWLPACQLAWLVDTMAQCPVRRQGNPE